MDAAYQLVVASLEPCSRGHTRLILKTAGDEARLAVRLDPIDAEAYAAEQAGVLTPRSRMASTMLQMMQTFDMTLDGILLRRNGANMLEAALLIDTPSGGRMLLINPADALMLARCAQAPIYGDASLAVWIQDAAEPRLVPAITAFLMSLAGPGA